MSTIRPPAVAGMFYPGEAGRLAQALAQLLAADDEERCERPRALIVPHAGYAYSGAIAATAYRRIAPWVDGIHRVVLLGPCHRVWVQGMALPRARAFDTPLGRIPVDACVDDLLALPEVQQSDAAHALEHALEVQLPFLQTLLDQFTLIPVVVGGASPEAVAALLDHCVDDSTLVVVSSDLSHFHTDAQARRIDAATAGRIEQLACDLRGEEACGAAPLNGLLYWARRQGLEIHRLALANSSDTTGPPERVVGYGAWCLDAPAERS
ncbi:MAG: AmmeMemoRadiSam system protein B [Pseudomonadales bacterium]|nr:AmmeMemoRadiSam system protein B [Pseudomonadales bacterium]